MNIPYPMDIMIPSRFSDHGSLKECLQLVRDWGFQGIIHEGALGSDPYYANTLPQRLRDFRRIVETSNHPMIWALRGGYGSTQVLAAYHRERQENKVDDLPSSKVLVGLSDMTAILLYAVKYWPHWRVIHGPVLHGAAKGRYDPESLNALRRLMEGTPQDVSYGSVIPFNDRAKQSMSHCQGPAIGGNLCLLQSAIGTPWQPDFEGHMVFAEDINETPLRTIERLHHLATATNLTKARGLVLFDFLDDHAPTPGMTQALTYAAENLLSLPVFKGQGVGHGRRSLPVVFGQPLCLAHGVLFQKESK